MREACAHTKACRAPLSEHLRPVSGRQQGLAQDDLRRHCLGAAESVMEVRRGGLHPDELAQEPQVESPVTGDLVLLQKELQNLPDIFDQKAAPQSACTCRALLPGDELPARQPVQASFPMLQAGQPWWTEPRQRAPLQVSRVERLVLLRQAQLRVSSPEAQLSLRDERQLTYLRAHRHSLGVLEHPLA